MRQQRVTNTPAKTHFVSNSRVEADQKDIIIDKLRAEAEALKKNEQEFAMLK